MRSPVEIVFRDLVLRDISSCNPGFALAISVGCHGTAPDKSDLLQFFGDDSPYGAGADIPSSCRRPDQGGIVTVRIPVHNTGRSLRS